MGYLKDCKDIFRSTKDGFVYVKDEDQHSVPEDWRFPIDEKNVKGDCDDFAIACRMQLKNLGYECRLVFCEVRPGSGHLICVIGSMALDNRFNWPTKLVDLVNLHGYRLISISGLNPGDPWREVSVDDKEE